MSTKPNYFSALLVDSDSDDEVKKPVVQKSSGKSVKIKQRVTVTKVTVTKAPAVHEAHVAEGSSNKVGLTFQPRVKQPSKKWSERVKSGGRPRFKITTPEDVWGQIIDSAVVFKGGKKLSQKERKRLAREERMKKREENIVSLGEMIV